MPVKGGPNIQTAQALVFLDSADRLSYPRSGNTWTNSISPGTYDGILNNGVGFDPDDALGSLVFTGSNSYVDVGNIGAISASFAFQVAVKPYPTSSGGVYTILSYTSGSGTGSLTFKLDYSSSSEIATLSTFVSSGSVNKTYNLTASVPLDSWSILHGVFGRGVFGFYKNGTPVSSVVATGSVTGYSSNNRLLVGGVSQFTGSYLSGSVANVMVYNSNLTRRSVTINYNGLATRFGLSSISTPLADEDVQAFFDRVAAAGGALTLDEEAAISTLVTELKFYNLWSKMKAIYPMVGASAAACKQNLKSSSFTGTFTSGWTFASTGVTPNGTSAYMDTGLNPSTELTKTNAHLSTYICTNSNAGNPYDIGNSGDFSANITPTYLITRYSTGLAYLGIADTSYATNISSTDSRGFFCGATNASSTQILYKNGTSIVTGTQASGNFANNNLYVGANNGGGLASLFSNKQTALVSIGDGLTNTEAANFYTIVQAFQTTLNRQV